MFISLSFVRNLILKNFILREVVEKPFLFIKHLNAMAAKIHGIREGIRV